MDRRDAPFRYRLEPLLKLDQWEGDALSRELRRARGLVDERDRLHRDVLRRIADAQAELRDLHRHDTIPIERTRLLNTYLTDQYALARSRESDLTRAQQLFEQIMAQRIAKQKRIHALEEQRERERSEHATEQSRAGQRDADEHWLQQRR